MLVGAFVGVGRPVLEEPDPLVRVFHGGQVVVDLGATSVMQVQGAGFGGYRDEPTVVVEPHQQAPCHRRVVGFAEGPGIVVPSAAGIGGYLRS